MNVRSGVLIAVALLFGSVGVAGASTSSRPPIKVHLTLTQTHVVAGQPIKGTAVLTNGSDRSITVNSCATNGWLAVGLSGQVDSYPFGSLLVACPPSVRLAPGANRFPITVITTYTSCVQPQPAGTPWAPGRHVPCRMDA